MCLSTSKQKLASARYLIREVQKGNLCYQDGRDLKLKMRRPYEYTEKQLLEIVQPECVILSLGEIEKPQTIRIGYDWIKGQDGKQAYEKPSRLKKNKFEQWFDQKVRSLYAKWEPDADKRSLDDPSLCTGKGKKDQEEDDQDPLDFLDILSLTIKPVPSCLESLTAVVDSRETRDKVAQLIELNAPKQQELVQTIRQVLQANPAISPRQARLEAYRILGISPAAGRNLLHRIRK